MSRGSDWSPVHSRPGTSSKKQGTSSPTGLLHQPSSLESGHESWSSETSALSAASAAQPQALSTWTSGTSALSAASSAQSHTSSALASSVGSSHTGSARHGSGKAQKPEPEVLAKVEERVKLVPMLHPDQRQHKEARLQAAIKDRLEAWAPLTDAQFRAYTPGRLQHEKEVAMMEEEAVTLRPAHFALPVPADRGHQRIAMHGIMRPQTHGRLRPKRKAEAGNRTKFRAAVEAVRVLSTEHRHYLAKQAVPPTHQDSRPRHQESGGKGTTWASSRVNSAYIKAVYVASFSKGAETAQKRREQLDLLQQQQQHSLHPLRAASPAVKGPACSWPKADHNGATTGLASLVDDGAACSWPVSIHSGEPPTIGKLASSKHPAAELKMHSRHSSPIPDEASLIGSEHSMHSRPTSGGHSRGISIQPLSRRPSTVAGHTRHAHPNSLAHTKQPADVDPATLQALKLGGGGESPGVPQLGRPSAKLVAKPARDLVLGGKRSAADVELFMPHNPMCQASYAKSPLKNNGTLASDADTQDAAVQHQVPPGELWLAAISAADADQLEKSQPVARCSGFQKPDSSGDSHMSLTANDVLAFVQGDLTTSNDSSPQHSPRPPCQAVGYISSLKARCALPASTSPGITPRLLVYSSDLGVGRFGAQSLDAQQEELAQTRERVKGLAERLAAQARLSLLDGQLVDQSALLQKQQQQVTPSAGSVPVWEEHLFREKDLFDAVEQSRADYTASSPMCHPLLLAIEGA
ncbi:hypothetical protein WJX77_005415 [Trebouxia sp. C0004]